MRTCYQIGVCEAEDAREALVRCPSAAALALLPVGMTGLGDASWCCQAVRVLLGVPAASLTRCSSVWILTDAFAARAAPALPAASGTRKLTTAVGGVVGDALLGGGVEEREPAKVRRRSVPSPSSHWTLYCRPVAACARAAARRGGGAAEKFLASFLQKSTVARVSSLYLYVTSPPLCIFSYALSERLKRFID